MSSRDCGKKFEARVERRAGTGAFYTKAGEPPRTYACGRLKGHTGDCGPRYCRKTVFGSGNPPGGAACGNRPVDGSLYCRRHDPSYEPPPKPPTLYQQLREARAALKAVVMAWELAPDIQHEPLEAAVDFASALLRNAGEDV